MPSRLGLLNTLTAFLQRGKPPPNKCPGYDTKQSDGEVPAMLELWGMQSTPSLPSLPVPVCPGVVASVKSLIYGLNRTNSIIIMSCHLHGYPWPSLATSPYHSLPLAGLQGYVPYPHIAAVCMFRLVVLLLLGHM